MSHPAAIIKTRTLLGELSKHGIEASRATGSGPAVGPGALLAAADGRAWLVLLWSGTTLQSSLLAEDETRAPTLDQTAARLVAWRQHVKSSIGDPAPALMILAPALPEHELPAGHWRIGQETVAVLCLRDCKKADLLATAILSRLSPVLPAEAAARWRAAVVPEVRIDRPFKRRAVTRAATALAAPLLLDYKQERCARLDLEPDPAAEALVRDLNLRLVTGVAGCGKTLVLVHRAALLATHFPNARVLLLSFNTPLINDLRRRLARRQTAGRVDCRTFHSWLAGIAASPGDMMSSYEIIRWIERERRPLLSLEKLSSEWLCDELHWMCDHTLADESYLTVERKGRGTRLSTHQRRDLLLLLRNYRAWLLLHKRGDWSEWALRVSENPPPALTGAQFDHLLIDEAQFFAPVWLDLLRRALKPGGHLFLCADPTQGFLRRRLSWSSLGLDVRSRSHSLKIPYRSTRAILQFARSFYQSRIPEDEEPLNLPAPDWLDTLESGSPPILQPAGPRQDQLNRIEAELRELFAHGTPPGDILILLAGRDFSETSFVDQLNARLGPQRAASSLKDKHAPAESIGVARLMAATGLERPIVFLLGLDSLAEEEANPTLTEEERAEKHHLHTRQIYVGLTRAMERLVIYSSHPGLGAAFGLESAIQSRITG